MTDATNNTTDEATPVEQPKQDKPKSKTPKVKSSKPAAKKPAPKAKKQAKAPEPSVTSVLAAELKVNPKILRAKLRRAGLKAPYTSLDKMRAALAKDDAK